MYIVKQKLEIQALVPVEMAEQTVLGLFSGSDDHSHLGALIRVEFLSISWRSGRYDPSISKLSTVQNSGDFGVETNSTNPCDSSWMFPISIWSFIIGWHINTKRCFFLGVLCNDSTCFFSSRWTQSADLGRPRWNTWVGTLQVSGERLNNFFLLSLTLAVTWLFSVPSFVPIRPKEKRNVPGGIAIIAPWGIDFDTTVGEINVTVQTGQG